jgi:hypothetical protein
MTSREIPESAFKKTGTKTGADLFPDYRQHALYFFPLPQGQDVFIQRVGDNSWLHYTVVSRIPKQGGNPG